MKAINLSEVQEAQEFEKVAVGGYVCGITAVEDVPFDKQKNKGDYLSLELDIAEGNQKNYYRGLYEAKGFWGLRTIKSYKETALPFFKGFVTAVENSNSGYKWNDDEKSLVRKLVGVVLSEEEYQANDGTVKTRLYVSDIRSIDKIRKGDFEVKPLKKLVGGISSAPASTIANFQEVADTDGVPF